jgi:hypothetical protein
MRRRGLYRNSKAILSAMHSMSVDVRPVQLVRKIERHFAAKKQGNDCEGPGITRGLNLARWTVNEHGVPITASPHR